MSVHPDHAALIADLREIRRCAMASAGTDKMPLSSAVVQTQAMPISRARLDAIIDALASAPSPRTPLPQEAAASELIAGLERIASNYADQDGLVLGRRMISFVAQTLATQVAALPQDATEDMVEAACLSRYAWWERPEYKVPSLREDMRKQINAALAAAPKVEQRTPTRDEIAEAARKGWLDWRHGARQNDYTEEWLGVASAVLALFTSPEAPDAHE